MLNSINFNCSRLPLEIIDEIADYHDYENTVNLTIKKGLIML